jgi:predicted nucleotidyltransferase
VDLSHPYKAAISGTDGDVLRVLAGSSQPFTGREIARLADCTHTTVQRSLDRLFEHGLVDRTPAGRAALYILNREHLAAAPVAALVAMRATLLDRLTAELSDWPTAPIQASLFGSAARGDGDTSSDIDLLVVRPDKLSVEDPDWRDRLDSLAPLVHRWTGNQLAILELTDRELEEMGVHRPTLVAELRSDAVTLVGPDLRTLLRAR